MSSESLIFKLTNALQIMDRMKEHFSIVQEQLLNSFHTVVKYHDEIKTIQSQFQSNLNQYREQSQPSTNTVNEPLQEIEDSNSLHPTSTTHEEPMTVKDAIKFLRKSKIHLSDYGYYISGSVQTRYNALKKAMGTYPIENILQKLRALIIVWSQNAADHIKYAEEYVIHLRTDFHTLQEESIKPKCA